MIKRRLTEDLDSFYYENGKKITADERHLLLSVSKTCETSDYWKFNKCAISDSSQLEVELTAEFNANRKDIAAKYPELYSCEI